MDDLKQFRDYRREAIRYWERRRIVWNVLLVPPSLLTYWCAFQFPDPDAHPEVFGFGTVAVLFFMAAAGANLCYCAAYIVEFFLADPDPECGWLLVGRPALFVIGCVIGIGLALLGGMQIADMQRGLIPLGNYVW